MSLVTAPRATVVAGLPGPALRRALWRRYVGLLREGVPASRILVLLDSPGRALWGDWLRGSGEPDPPPPTTIAAPRIHTPGAWIQETLRMWWPVVEEALAARGLEAEARYPGPLFTAVNVAQHVVAQSRTTALFIGARTPEHLQHVQVLDTLARGIEHGAHLAPFPAEWPDGWRPDVHPDIAGLAGYIAKRLHEGLEPAEQARELPWQVGRAMADSVALSFAHRTFDHALQLLLFAEVLWPDPRFRARLRETDFVLVEHLDETTPRLQGLLADMLADGAGGYATRQSDPEPGDFPFHGGLREFVGADPRGALAMTQAWTAVPHADDPPLAPLGRALHDALNGAPRRRVAVPKGRLAAHLAFPTLRDMLGAVAERLETLLGDGVDPTDIVLVVPSLNPALIWSLQHRLASTQTPLYVFAGTNRLTDYRPVRLLLTLARLASPEGQPPGRYDMLELLEFAVGVNPLKLARHQDDLFPEGKLADALVVADLDLGLTEAALARYAGLAQWIAEHPATGTPVAFFAAAFGGVYAVYRPPSAGGLAADEAWQREVSQIGQLLELSEHFADADARLSGEPGVMERFLAFLARCPIAERPFFRREPHEQAIVLATASQFAEKGVQPRRVAHVFWLDLGADDWKKPDRRELTNPRVLSRHWPGGADNLLREDQDMDAKLGRVLMACCLKADHLHAYACLTDAEGRENQGQLPNILQHVARREAAE